MDTIAEDCTEEKTRKTAQNNKDGDKMKMIMAGLCVFLAFLSAAYGIMLFAAIGRQALLLSCICLSGAAWWAWCARWFVRARLIELEQQERMRRRVLWAAKQLEATK